jgi:hypothetical protein
MARQRSGRAEEVAASIKQLHFEFTEVDEFDFTLLSPERRIQGRDSHHDQSSFAPADAIRRYAAMMDDVPMSFTLLPAFPPGIVTPDAWIIDGNTRIGAKLERGEKIGPMFVLTESYADASPERQEQMALLAGAQNLRNGTPYTASEIAALLPAVLAQNWDNRKSAAFLGMNLNKITEHRAEMTARERLAEVEIEPGGLSKRALRGLGSEVVTSLSDTRLPLVAELTRDAELTQKETKDVARQLHEAESDDDAADQIAELREGDLARRISDRTLALQGRSVLPRQLRGWIEKFVDHNPSEWVEYMPDHAAKHHELLVAARDHFDKVIERQDEQDSRRA